MHTGVILRSYWCNNGLDKTITNRNMLWVSNTLTPMREIVRKSAQNIPANSRTFVFEKKTLVAEFVKSIA